MSIKYAVLGLLAEEPLHGYALHAAFERRLGEFWELNYGQVYQVLTALEGEGLIVASDERVGRRPPRKVYAVSALGRDAFRAWLAGAAPRVRPFRDDFYIRLLFASRSSAVAIHELIEAQVERCWAHLSDLVQQRDGAPSREAPFETIVRRLFVEAAVLHMEASVRALELSRSVFARLHAGEPVEALLPEATDERALPRSRQAGGRKA